MSRKNDFIHNVFFAIIYCLVLYRSLCWQCNFWKLPQKPPIFFAFQSIEHTRKVKRLHLWTKRKPKKRDVCRVRMWFKPTAIKESDTCIAHIGCRAGEFMRYANASFNLIVSSIYLHVVGLRFKMVISRDFHRNFAFFLSLSFGNLMHGSQLHAYFVLM